MKTHHKRKSCLQESDQPAHCLTGAFCSREGFIYALTILCTSLTTPLFISIPTPSPQITHYYNSHSLSNLQMSSPLPAQPHPFFADGVQAATEHLLTVDNGEAHGDVKFRIRNLAKKSDTTGASILNGLTLDIPKGVIMGVIGPSGSGKSTLLRALNRLWEPPSGTVFLDGHDILDTDVLSLRRKVGMLFQLPVLFEGTVADNIRYGPQLKGRKLSDEDVHKLLNLVDLDSFFATKTGSEMSVGQSQRVALARTLANSPEVLLLDEPTSALDPISTEHIEGALVKLKQKQGMTIVMVSHSIKQIQRIADIVCLLVDGEIVEVLKPDQLSQANHPMALRFLQLSS